MIAFQQQKPLINNKALAWTVGIHALLFLLFFLIRYTIEPKVPQIENGLEVNLGSSDNGSGTDQPMSPNDPGAYQDSVVYKNTPTASNVPKNMMETNDANAPSVSEPTKKPGKPQEVIKEKPPKPEKPKYTYGGDAGPGGNKATQNSKGTSEGITNGPGDQGVAGGTPGASNYSGTPGNGSGGIGHTLTGRQISPEKFEAEFREGGKVVIHVTVDRNGNIIDKRVKSSSNAQLTRIALDKLNQSKFSKSDGTEPQQFGDVTIVFKTRQ